MIAILGETEDEILYFKSRMDLEETITLFGNFKVYKGKLSQEDAVVAATGSTNYLSAMRTSLLLKSFEPYLVINVGSVFSFSSQLRQGDIFLAERYYFSDVDFTARGYKFGEIPAKVPFFVADTSLNGVAEKLAFLVSDRYVQRGYLLSGNAFVDSDGILEKVVGAHYLSDEGLMAYDNISGGIALACQEASVALLSIKGVARQLGKEDQDINYTRKGLEIMLTIGQIVAKFLLEKEKD